MVFIGFGIALVHKFLTTAGKLWPETPSGKLYTTDISGTKAGLKGAGIGGELSPELLGVGFLIGPKIASLMLAGAVLSYLVLGPLIATFGEKLTVAISPAAKEFIEDMDPGDLQENYLRYIGAGAVAAGGIISMFRALPLIFGSIFSGLRDLRATAGGKQTTRRTERDMSMAVVLFGSLGMVAAMMFIPALGLGVTMNGFLGALMILVFSFLFVTVSSRLTGEIGSSSNPISGMTIATLLLTCLIFLLVGQTGHASMLTALTVAAVVCIASSNGGTTSQDLKTGYLIGATPRPQQYGILVGALVSALVIGGTMLALDAVATYYTDVKTDMAKVALVVPTDAPKSRVGIPHAEVKDEFWIVHVTRKDAEEIKQTQKAEVAPGRYLVDGSGFRQEQRDGKTVDIREGRAQYRTEIPIGRKEGARMDGGADAPKGFTAPQPQLFSSIIEGILGGTLEWGLFGIGALIAIALELASVRALPFAVGMYLPISLSIPIFLGGMLRWLIDKLRGVSASEAETETSPGVLLSSGYIAGGTVCGLLIAFFAVLPDQFNRVISPAHIFGASQISKVDDKQIGDFNAKIAEIKSTEKAEETQAKDDAAKAKAERKAKNAIKFVRREHSREAAVADIREAKESGAAEEAKAKNDEEKANISWRTQLAIDSINRKFWLDSGLSQILALLAFAILAAILFRQGLAKAPELPPAPTAPPPGQPDTPIQA